MTPPLLAGHTALRLQGCVTSWGAGTAANAAMVCQRCVGRLGLQWASTAWASRGAESVVLAGVTDLTRRACTPRLSWLMPSSSSLVSTPRSAALRAGSQAEM